MKFKRAWRVIAENWPTMNLAQQVAWVIFFPLLYLLAITALYSTKPPEEKR